VARVRKTGIPPPLLSLLTTVTRRGPPAPRLHPCSRKLAGEQAHATPGRLCLRLA